MKWAYLAIAVITCVVAFLLAIDDGYENRTAVFIFVVVAGTFFLSFLWLDWREDRALRRRLESEKALSRERAKIVGDFVHRAGKGTRDGR